MKLRFEVDQADSFRRGIDRPKSIVSIDVNPADVPESARSLIADHLVGIDVLEFFYHHGEVIKGYPIKELSHTSREPKRIVAKSANLDGLIEAIAANDNFIQRIKESFNQPVQFRMLDKVPKNEGEFAFISSQRPNQVDEIAESIRQKRRIWFEAFLENIQRDLSRLLHEHSYIVYLLPTPPFTAQARFYCEPVFAAEFSGRPVVAHSPIIVLNEKTGRIVEASNLFRALEVYLLPGLRPGRLVDDLSILTWENNKWVIVSPEGLMDLANEAQAKTKAEPVEA